MSAAVSVYVRLFMARSSVSPQALAAGGTGPIFVLAKAAGVTLAVDSETALLPANARTLAVPPK
jgi:hypothetical protein